MTHICHRSGEYVPRNLGGHWRDSNGHVINVQGGDVFPPCRYGCGKTGWCLVH